MLRFLIKILISILSIPISWALEPSVSLQVWTNEAIVNTFTFNSQNFQMRHQDIAQYFSPETWKTYIEKLNKSKILKEIQTNHFEVSAVATSSPTIKIHSQEDIQAEMPILVTYKNTEQTITQNLKITLKLMHSPNKGVREYVIKKFQSTNISAPCGCSQSQSPKVTIA